MLSSLTKCGNQVRIKRLRNLCFLVYLARPSRLFAAFGRESLAALGTAAAARRRPSRRLTAPLVELPTPWFVGKFD